MSRKYHPDKNKEPGAEEKFVEIAYGKCSLMSCVRQSNFFFIAYEILSDPTVSVLMISEKTSIEGMQKRQIYDRHGEVLASKSCVVSKGAHRLFFCRKG